eukprot:SAG11_NODE_16632_length_542_cov_0.695260_2_plen_47_part_00
MTVIWLETDAAHFTVAARAGFRFHPAGKTGKPRNEEEDVAMAVTAR